MIELECVKRTDPRYKEIRDRHYIENKGCQGQQLHYLAFDDNALVGIISGASAVFGCKPRDVFFGLSKTREIKQAQINAIVSNVVFRLEAPAKNRATRVLATWRRRIAKDWEHLYGVPVAGFETFVIEERREGMSDRLGTLYKADNWTLVGTTTGNTKQHATEKGSGGMNAPHTRRTVVSKLILCKKVKGVKLPETYLASWRDKDRSKVIAKRRAEMLGKRY